MKSPFPGMDPYLESHWGDVHQRLVTYASDHLQSLLPKDLRARVEERVFVESSDVLDERVVYPDVRIFERPAQTAGRRAVPSGLTLAEPLVVEIPNEPVTEGFVEIREAGPTGRVVTVIEILRYSPTSGEDQRDAVGGGCVAR